jgi:hypothetical protein
MLSSIRSRFSLFPLLTLRKEINFLLAHFQDPDFMKKDQEFLEQRGHTVLKWNSNELSTDTLDPRLLDVLSKSTFCYLPCLDLPIVVAVIHAA